MRRSFIWLAITACAIVPLVPIAAGADVPGTTSGPRSHDDIHCLAQIDVALSPGISMTPSSGTFSTGGETGTSTCDGPIHGYIPTGIGTRGEKGRYGVDGPTSCTNPAGVAEWTVSFTMPTAAGPQHVDFPVRGHYGPFEGGGVYGGTFTGQGMYGHYTIRFLKGDCVTSPITLVHVDCDEWIIAKP